MIQDAIYTVLESDAITNVISKMRSVDLGT